MLDVSGPGDGIPDGVQRVHSIAGPEGSRPNPQLAGKLGSGWRFIALYTPLSQSPLQRSQRCQAHALTAPVVGMATNSSPSGTTQHRRI
jgi:hypothetical protein